jgi:hypothetical protein
VKKFYASPKVISAAKAKSTAPAKPSLSKSALKNKKRKLRAQALKAPPPNPVLQGLEAVVDNIQVPLAGVLPPPIQPGVPNDLRTEAQPIPPVSITELPSQVAAPSNMDLNQQNPPAVHDEAAGTSAALADDPDVVAAQAELLAAQTEHQRVIAAEQKKAAYIALLQQKTNEFRARTVAPNLQRPGAPQQPPLSQSTPAMPRPLASAPVARGGPLTGMPNQPSPFPQRLHDQYNIEEDLHGFAPTSDYFGAIDPLTSAALGNDYFDQLDTSSSLYGPQAFPNTTRTGLAPPGSLLNRAPRIPPHRGPTSTPFPRNPSLAPSPFASLVTEVNHPSSSFDNIDIPGSIKALCTTEEENASTFGRLSNQEINSMPANLRHELLRACNDKSETLRQVEALLHASTAGTPDALALAQQAGISMCAAWVDIFKKILTAISRSQSASRILFESGPATSRKFLQISTSQTPFIDTPNLVESLKQQDGMTQMRLQSSKTKHDGQASGYSDDPNKKKQLLSAGGAKRTNGPFRAFCDTCQNHNVTHAPEDCLGINRGGRQPNGPRGSYGTQQQPRSYAPAGQPQAAAFPQLQSVQQPQPYPFQGQGPVNR